ncbi:MAG: response regulator [Anaerolineales bacterium]
MAQVLIIDDQIQSVKMLSMAVRMLGHEALEALRGEDAVNLVNGSKPDIVFLDYRMPGMDGLATLEHLRSLPNAKDLPIYLLTATKDIYLEERARAAGARGFLQKPVNLDELEGLLAA